MGAKEGILRMISGLRREKGVMRRWEEGLDNNECSSDFDIKELQDFSQQ